MRRCFLVVLVTGVSGGLLPAGSVPKDFVPGGIDTAGLNRIVPDTECFFNDPNMDDVREAQLGNWEPYSSVLGNSVFLIQSNTFAVVEGDPPAHMMRFGVVFQPVAGGVPLRCEAFFADDDEPYCQPINASRQNGNPGRVAGDQRPGAVNFIAGGEANPDQYPEFHSDDRWEAGVIRGGGRFATVQTHSLDTETLSQAPGSKAFDAVLGRLTRGDASIGAGGAELGRLGELAGLSDGNFLAVVDDRSNLIGVERSATAVIVAPDGSIIRDSFLIGAGEIWSNVAAFKDGFCVRLNGLLKFYDNAGDFLGEKDQDEAKLTGCGGATAFSFDRGRGDGTRIASHVNSNYVFLAGRNNEPVQQVRLAAWDARDRSFQGAINVNELSAASGGTDPADFRPPFDRVNLAVDALNRVVVTYEVTPAGFSAQQVAARVLAFTDDDDVFTYLTPTFFPFQNHIAACEGIGLPIRTFRPSPSITTRQILVAAKGEFNTRNEPEHCADVPGETNLYTVISHPAPEDDPTPPVEPPGGVRPFLRGDCKPVVSHTGQLTSAPPHPSSRSRTAPPSRT